MGKHPLLFLFLVFTHSFCILCVCVCEYVSFPSSPFSNNSHYAHKQVPNEPLIYNHGSFQNLYINADTDSGGSQDFNRMTCVKNSYRGTRAFSVISDVNFEGDFVHAIDVGGSGGQIVGDANFTACNPSIRNTIAVCPGDKNVYIEAAHEYIFHGCDSCTDNDELNHALTSFRLESYPKPLNVEIRELEPEMEYELQLFFVEQSLDRGFYIYVDDEIIAPMNAYRSAGGFNKPTVFVHRIKPSSTTISIQLWGNDKSGSRISGHGSDQSTRLHALTLRRISTNSFSQTRDPDSRQGGGLGTYYFAKNSILGNLSTSQYPQCDVQLHSSCKKWGSRDMYNQTRSCDDQSGMLGKDTYCPASCDYTVPSGLSWQYAVYVETLDSSGAMHVALCCNASESSNQVTDVLNPDVSKTHLNYESSRQYCASRGARLCKTKELLNFDGSSYDDDYDYMAYEWDSTAV